MFSFLRRCFQFVFLFLCLSYIIIGIIIAVRIITDGSVAAYVAEFPNPLIVYSNSSIINPIDIMIRGANCFFFRRKINVRVSNNIP